jgi:hypothetical protein
VAERRVLDAIALAAWEQGHRFLLPWRILAAVLFGGGFSGPSWRRERPIHPCGHGRGRLQRN